MDRTFSDRARRDADRSPGSTRIGRHAWVLVLATGLAGGLAIRIAIIRTDNPVLLPSAILLGAAVVPVAFLTYLGGRSLPSTVNAAALAVTAVVGGVTGVLVANSLEFRMLQGGPGDALRTAVVEEAAKLIVPVGILVWGRFRRPADGLLIGAAAGAGFAVLETMGYAFVTLLDSGWDSLDVRDLLVVRGLTSPATHMAWTALAATALWFAAARWGWSWRSVPTVAGALGVAITLHAGWDVFDGPLTFAVLAFLSLVLLGATVAAVERDGRRGGGGSPSALGGNTAAGVE